MLGRWINFINYLHAITSVGMAYAVYLFSSDSLLFIGIGIIVELWVLLSAVIFIGAGGLLAISLLAISLKQGRLVVLKPYLKMIFSKQHFEGMTFFKWGVLIIGLIFALAFLEFVKNVTG